MQPGVHTVVVRGHDEQLYQRNYAVSIRERDIGNVKLIDVDQNQKQFSSDPTSPHKLHHVQKISSEYVPVEEKKSREL